MTDSVYEKFVKRWEEVTEVPPQRMGRLTPVYKDITKHLKVMPWPLLGVLSIMSVICLYALLGSAITFVVNLLQRGF